MNWLLLFAWLFSASTVAPAAGAAAEVATLELRIENIASHQGTIWVGIYESEDDFLNRERARLIHRSVRHMGSTQVLIDGLTINKRYAVAVFHDVNDNGDLDTNWLGLPAEPYALSRPLQSWFRAPRFEEMSFVFRPEHGLLPLRLR
ncbi:MAG: DUF2141 domain-containing protein [Lewinella sp.]